MTFFLNFRHISIRFFFDDSISLKNFSYKTWDCSTCRFQVENLARLYLMPASHDLIVSDLYGETFCRSPELNLEYEDIYFCENIVYEFIPPALSVLFEEILINPDDVCQVVYDGVC